MYSDYGHLKVVDSLHKERVLEYEIRKGFAMVGTKLGPLVPNEENIQNTKAYVSFKHNNRQKSMNSL